MQFVLESVGLVPQRDKRALQGNLEPAAFSCKWYQDTLFPCGHAITVMHRLRRAPIECIPAYAKPETWIATCTQNFLSIVLADIGLVFSRGRVLGDGAGNDDSDSDSGLSELPLSDFEPPLTRTPRERPNKRNKRGDGLRNLRSRLADAGALPDIPDSASTLLIL